MVAPGMQVRKANHGHDMQILHAVTAVVARCRGLTLLKPCPNSVGNLDCVSAKQPF